MTFEEKRKIDKLRSEGVGCTAISDMLGISINSVKSYCRRSKSKKEKVVVRKSVKGGCNFCGNALVHTEGKKKKRFCCEKCRMSWWNHNRDKIHHRVLFEITCRYCGGAFKNNDKNRKFCSQQCYKNWRCSNAAK